MKTLVAITLFLFPLFASAQWFEIGRIDNPEHVVIASEDTIYSFKNQGVGPDNGTIGTVYGHGDTLYQTTHYSGCCPINDLFFLTKDTGFLIYSQQAYGILLRTNDGGNTWSPPGCNLPSPNEQDIQYLTTDMGYCILGYNYYEDSGMFRRCIDGNSFDTLLPGYRFDDNSKVYFTGINSGFILARDAGDHPLVIRSTDMGNSWNTVLASNGSAFRCIHFPSSDHGFIAGDSGRVYKTLNNGVNWTESVIDPGISWLDIFFMNDSCGFVVGTGGNAYYTADAGMTWVKQEFPTSHDLVKVHFVTDSTGFICSSLEFSSGEGKLFKTTNLGTVGGTDHYPGRTTTVTVYPNPTNGPVSIKDLDVSKTEIYSPVGGLIMTLGKGTVDADLSSLPAGVYFLKIYQGEQAVSRKLILQK